MGIKEIADQTAALDILIILSKKEIPSITELVRILLPHSSTTTTIALRLLERKGLVVTVKAMDRSKRMSVSLTPKGRECIKHIDAINELLIEN